MPSRAPASVRGLGSRHCRRPFASALAAVSLLCGGAHAQSVIVSAPNTDTTPKGIVMLAHESQVNAWSQSKLYWNSFTFSTYGLTKNLELAATLYGVSRPGSGNVALAAGYKQRIPLPKVGGFEPAFAFGQMLPVSLSGKGVGTWTYGVASVRVPGLRTRFTAGPSYGSEQVFGSRTLHALLGIEQPLNDKFMLIADWFTGRHDLAALVTGLQWHAAHGFIVIVGYKFPNVRRAGPASALCELTYEF